MADKLLTTAELAEYLRVAEDTVKFWARTGKIPRIKAGKGWRFNLSDVLDVLDIPPVIEGETNAREDVTR